MTLALRLSTLGAALLCLVGTARSWPTDSQTAACQAKLDAFCATDCYDKIKGRGCDGPMRARRGGPHDAEWRCYSPSTLRSDNVTYSSGDCYCSRDEELSQIAAECMPERCSTMQNDFCEQDCHLESSCDGPTRARFSTAHGSKGSKDFRCYSPSTLDANGDYKGGSCYCTRNDDLWQTASDCLAGLTRSRVFVDGTPDHVCYRIPAIVQTTEGTLVAFAEARHYGCGDSNTREIATTRSTDGGLTWSPVQWAATPPTSAGNVGNPMPFALNDGTVALAFVYRNKKGGGAGDGNGIVFSHDDGITWSDMRDISSGFGTVAGTMPGPGAGVVLKGSNRLILPSHDGPYKNDYVTISDDGGNTWRTVDHKFPKMDEVAIADIGNGNVLLNFRHKGEKTEGRGIARSRDGGLTWYDFSFDHALKGPVCQASMAMVGEVLYFVNPDSTSGRSHITVKRSFDLGHNWDSEVYEIQRDVSQGYSSIVQGTVQAGQGGVLFESSSTPHGGSIDFKTFPLDF